MSRTSPFLKLTGKQHQSATHSLICRTRLRPECTAEDHGPLWWWPRIIRDGMQWYTVLPFHTKHPPVAPVLGNQSARGLTFSTDTIMGCFKAEAFLLRLNIAIALLHTRKRDIRPPSSSLQAARKARRNSLFCSSSLISSGAIFSLSTWSRSTLAHFCSDSMMVQGLDMSTTNTAKQLGRDCGETANFSRPLWYRSPSRIHTLQRVRSVEDRQNVSPSITAWLLIYAGARRTHHLCPHRGRLGTDTPGPVLSYCDQLLAV